MATSPFSAHRKSMWTDVTESTISAHLETALLRQPKPRGLLVLKELSLVYI